jgi:hypothetical protein
LEQKTMQLLSAIMHLDPAHLFVAGAAVVSFFGWAGSDSSDEQEEDDYAEYASWNPASVNYSE